jgi:hypothetical protein
VDLTSELHEKQLENTRQVLMGLSEDSMLKPLRQMSGLPAPGEDLGGWYHYEPNYVTGGYGFAPACHFGQWVSALARMYAIQKDPALRDKVLRLNRLYAQTISGDFYEKNRFPTYCYDKFVCGLIDSHKYVADADAFKILDHSTETALPHFPLTRSSMIRRGVRTKTRYGPGMSLIRFRRIFSWPISAARVRAIASLAGNTCSTPITIRSPKDEVCCLAGTPTAM